jgi:hypothetical protein
MIKIVLFIGFFSLQLTSQAQGYDAELISQKTDIEISNGRLTKNLYYEIKINNRAGVKYTNIEIPYSKLIKVSKIEAYIKDSNGSIVKKLKMNEITERSSISDFSLYEDDYVKEFTLKYNSYPYTIICTYQIQETEFINIVDWTPIIDEKIPTLSASLKVSVPLDYKIAYKNQLVDEPAIDTIEKTISYQWNTSYTGIIKNEEYSPPVSDFLPFVEVVPKEFHYDIKGSFRDWISFGNWQNDLLKELNVLPANEIIKIQSLTKNIEDDKEKVKILYHYLQDETRYINVTIETGGLKPYPASYVSQNKYGDCKALTNYFKSFLDYLHIPSYYSIVYAGSPVKKTDRNFPSSQFNHVILNVPLKSENIWLDCTSDGAFNYLGTFTQNRDAFLISRDNSRIVKTPALQARDVLDSRKITINYSPEEATVKFQNLLRSNLYQEVLFLEKGYSESDKSRIIRNYFGIDGFQIVDYKILLQDRDSVKIELDYDATTQRLYKHYGNDILVSNIPFSLRAIEKPQVRKLPLQIDYPINNVDTIIYEIPKGYKLSNDPANYLIVSKYGEYKKNTREDAGNIITIKSLLINSGNYPVSEYEEFYKFYNRIAESENKTSITLSK